MRKGKGEIILIADLGILGHGESSWGHQLTEIVSIVIMCRIICGATLSKESKGYRREREKSLADLNVSSRTSVAIEQCEERLN